MAPALRLFNLDLHVSVIEDFKAICKTLYGDNLEITNWSISGHNFIFDKPDREVVGVNQDTWMTLDEQKIKEFHEAYDEELSKYDGFVVTHTPVFVMLFEKYNKPILVINSCRYDQPFCFKPNPHMNTKFHECLHRLHLSGRLRIVSNNYSDELYLLKGAKLQSTVIPSLCLYVNIKHEPSAMTFMCYGDRKFFPEHPLLVERPETGYTWVELYKTRGFVHIPYEMSTMSIFEQYWSGAPLFFPSQEFYTKCMIENKIKFISTYSNADEDIPETVVNQWLFTADFYKLPYIYYYDSEEDLLQKIMSFEDIYREKRIEYIQHQTKCILERWTGVLESMF